MSYERAKALALNLGTYRFARWINRHVMNRAELTKLRSELAFYRQVIEPSSLCFDVGANYGLKTEVFLRLGARVVAFEPQSDCVEELRARLGPNPHLVTVNAAVGSTKGVGTFYIQRHRTKSSFARDWPGEVLGSREVPITTLDEAIVEFGTPDYCKIDVEGHELEVFKGLNHAFKCISFEYHLDDDGLAKALACLNRLALLGSLEINITPAESPIFARSTWWDLEDFLDFFPDKLRVTNGYHYGDIFVRIKPFHDRIRDSLECLVTLSPAATP